MVVSTRCRILLAAAALSGACGSETHSITQPDPITGTTSITPVTEASSAVTHVLKGTVVDEDGQAVAGANVKFWVANAPPTATAVTDANGTFELTTGSPPPRIPHLVEPVLVEKPGYEASVGLVDDSCCGRVRLYRIRQITAGANVTLALFNDAFCGDVGYDFACRRIRVNSPSKGILSVRVTPEDFMVVLADGPGRPPFSPGLSVPVDAHSEIS